MGNLAKNFAKLDDSDEFEHMRHVVCHDLNGPLRAINCFLDMLKFSLDETDEDAMESFQVIKESTGKLEELISGLGTYMKTIKKELQAEECDLKEIIEAVGAELGENYSDKNPSININGDLGTCKADKKMLENVLKGMIDNSMKFCEQKPEISIESEPLDKKLKISLEDNGIGIDEEQFERIFVIFQRLHTAEEYKGNGLGLAMARKIISKHGGELWLESKPGLGTKFSFTLPL